MDKPELVIIDEKSLETCRQFASDSVSTSLNCYARRGQSNPRKIEQQILNGKIGEFGVYKFLTDAGQECSLPDTRILQRKEKSFDYDLVAPDFNIHVKTQDYAEAKKFGSSWVFQCSPNKNANHDSHVFKVYDAKKDYVAFCTLFGNNLAVVGFVKVADLHAHDLFKEMKVWQLRNTKKAVYYDDIVGANIWEDIRKCQV